MKNLYKDKVNKSKSCKYCFEEKVHPAFLNEQLCLSCASEVIEDFKTKKERFDNKLKTNETI